MYIICWTTADTLKNTWELISGEDAMQIRVDELYKSGLDDEDIYVFELENELK